MKFITTFAATVLLSFNLAACAAAEGAIADRETWLADAVAQIESGDMTDLEDTIKATLGDTMHEDVEDLMAPLTNVMGDHKPLYVDKIVHEEMGTSFDQHIYAAYYGHREFLFYSFTFARLEDGWQLYSLDFADSLAGLNPITN